jgi:hypothetical protein
VISQQMTRRTVGVMTGCALFAGCGGGDGSAAGGEPITPAAIAAIAQEHVHLEPRRIAQWDVFTRELGVESPGAWLEYADVSLHVVVAPTSDSPLVCAVPTFFDECLDESVDDHDVTIAWQELEPEEDPGVVYVIDRRGGEDVAVGVSGASVTGDPRNLNLGVPLADLAALVTDPRLSLTTSQVVVDLGTGVEIELPEGNVATAPQ